ncbi:uncharacterized protein LOC110057501 [Orbicella faveolata]|uniref:uncharacterized protein LOC110057501 n=1 Tax=Orbicella faveolata TaxID=48498 RepID=UPI0009E1F947|nr:uncharacterized protein LOC110057501 [Orbicella faveolata]
MILYGETSCRSIYLSVSRPTSSPTPSLVPPFNTTKSTALPSFTVKPTSSGFTPVMSSSVVSTVTIPPHVQRILVSLLGSLTRIIQRLQALLGGSLSPADLDNFQSE